MTRVRGACLVIACGALAREIAALRGVNRWEGLVDVQCLPAELHNRPERIPAAVQDAIRRHRAAYPRIYVAYADCGTGGRLDAVLAEEGVERIPGAHCYEFFAGPDAFARLADEEPGTFYLTDFLARHFDRLVLQGLGLDRHPELMPMYFGNYRRLVYLAQTPDPLRRARLRGLARQAAVRLGLAFEEIDTGYGVLQSELVRQAAPLRFVARPEHPVAEASCPS